MNTILRSDKLKNVHSDIRGPIYFEALKMQREGIDVLRLNTGNPGVFNFQMPDSVRQALISHVDDAVAYCDLRGMPDAREAICAYQKSKGFQNITPDDIFIGNGVSELVTMVLTALLNYDDEIPDPRAGLFPVDELCLDGGGEARLLYLRRGFELVPRPCGYPPQDYAEDPRAASH